jgi:acyl-CoA thioester hydrolase
VFSHTIQVRIRYSETDRMGYAYYGNYATYFEVARVEALRQLGVNYKELEDEGTLLPVSEFSIKYLKPAFYDDVISVTVSITKLPTARIHFYYETKNTAGVLINTGETVLVFVDKTSGKPKPAPARILDKLKQFIHA